MCSQQSLLPREEGDRQPLQFNCTSPHHLQGTRGQARSSHVLVRLLALQVSSSLSLAMRIFLRFLRTPTASQSPFTPPPLDRQVLSRATRTRGGGGRRRPPTRILFFPCLDPAPRFALQAGLASLTEFHGFDSYRRLGVMIPGEGIFH